MRTFKLTKPDWTTKNGVRWGPGVTNRVQELDTFAAYELQTKTTLEYVEGHPLCTPAWIHHNPDPVALELFSPNLLGSLSGDYILWEAEVPDSVPTRYEYRKFGSTSLTTLRPIHRPRLRDRRNRRKFVANLILSLPEQHDSVVHHKHTLAAAGFGDPTLELKALARTGYLSPRGRKLLKDRGPGWLKQETNWNYNYYRGTYLFYLAARGDEGDPTAACVTVFGSVPGFWEASQTDEKMAHDAISGAAALSFPPFTLEPLGLPWEPQSLKE